MKIKRLSVCNVTSYDNNVTFTFDNGLNIMIGPNGGGKSNLQKILAMVLSTFFIPQYEFKSNDNEVGITPLELWNRRQLRKVLQEYLGRENEDQIIEIELAPDEADIQNIKTIGENLDLFNEQLNYWESPRKKYKPYHFVDKMNAGDSLIYQVKNWELETPKTDVTICYLEYLKTFFIFMRLSQHISNVNLTSPVFFFFSERKSNRRALNIQSNQLTETQYYQGFRNAYQAAMGDTTDLMQWGAQHFVRIYWKLVNEAAQKQGETINTLFNDNPVVEQLTQYINALGYQWSFLIDQDNVSYTLVIRKNEDSPWLTADKFSSGESEIIHFLFALFALNVKDGVIIIDEPELHLHPRWQRIFLDLFKDISPQRNNQFLIATHSPVFVTPDTVDNVIRISRRNGNEGSDRVVLREVELPKKHKLVRMINSHNNERVFFADFVVLVEGISDRIIFSSLIQNVAMRIKNFKAIEVVEVCGKHNFDGYRQLLSSLETPSFIIADLDYIFDIGGKTIKDLFETDSKKMKSALTDKKSLDSKKFISLLKDAIESKENDELFSFLHYVESRCRQLKNPLSGAEKKILMKELIKHRKENILILGDGEIESYLPDNVSTVEEIVEMIDNPLWINDVGDKSHRKELMEMIVEILYIDDPVKSNLLTEAINGQVSFNLKKGK